MGSSFASPVAAGIAALVLQFARQEPLNCSDSVSRVLSTPRGMKTILRTIFKQGAGDSSFRVLYPWVLSDHKDEVLDQREQAARTILKSLEKEYGVSKVGYEIEWGTLQWWPRGKVEEAGSESVVSDVAQASVGFPQS
jgi:hypothetical protein